MPNSTGICDVFKRGILTGNVNLNTATVKAALYLASATYNNTTTQYASTGEVSGSGYTSGGVTAAAGTVGLTGNIAYWQPSSQLNYGVVTLSTAFDAVLLYYTNNSQTVVTASNAIAVFNFGSTTVNNGTFTINLPTPGDATNGLIRLT